MKFAHQIVPDIAVEQMVDPRNRKVDLCLTPPNSHSQPYDPQTNQGSVLDLYRNDVRSSPHHGTEMTTIIIESPGQGSFTITTEWDGT